MMRAADTARSEATRMAEARRRAADTARAEARIRADVAWERTYSATFSQVYDETLAELLDERETSA
jgi:hypothetical protein